MNEVRGHTSYNTVIQPAQVRFVTIQPVTPGSPWHASCGHRDTTVFKIYQIYQEMFPEGCKMQDLELYKFSHNIYNIIPIEPDRIDRINSIEKQSYSNGHED